MGLTSLPILNRMGVKSVSQRLIYSEKSSRQDLVALLFIETLQTHLNTEYLFKLSPKLNSKTIHRSFRGHKILPQVLKTSTYTGEL